MPATHPPRSAAALLAAMLDAAERGDAGTLAALGELTPDEVEGLAGVSESAPGLVEKDVTVHRGGRTFTQHRLVRAADEPGPAAYRKAFADPASVTPAEKESLAAHLQGMPVASLKTYCQVHRLKTDGSKAVLAARVLAHVDAHHPPAPEPARAGDGHPWPDHPAARHVREALDRSALPPEQAAEYGAAAAAVLSRIPAAGRDRMAKALGGGSKFYPDAHSLGLGVMDAAIAAAETPEQAAKLSATRADMAAGKRRIGGAYMRTAGGSVHLDGGMSTAPKGGPHGGRAQAASEVYAHEFGHAIDGPGKEISRSPEWAEAYAKEIGPAAGPEPRLSGYATTSAAEGFAEFARLVYGGKVPAAEVERAFPLASRLFKEHGLWPQS